MFQDALGSAMAAVNRSEAAPGSARRPEVDKVLSSLGNSVIPLDVWEERCRRLKEEAQPRRRVRLADYDCGAGQDGDDAERAAARGAAQQETAQDQAGAALSALVATATTTTTTPRGGGSTTKQPPPRRKRITEQVVLKARIETVAKTAALSGPGPYEEPFGGPYLPGISETPRQLLDNNNTFPQVGLMSTAGGPAAPAASARKRGYVRPRDPQDDLKEGLTFRGPYKVKTIMPHWNFAKDEKAPRQSMYPAPRDVKSRDATAGRGDIRDSREHNLAARKRLGEMLVVPPGLMETLRLNEEWFLAIPGQTLEVPSGRLNPKLTHPARSAWTQIPEANLRVA